MSLSEKHAKILWGRAAGHCSKPDCRIKLSVDANDGGVAHFGEHAHMIPDREGPRAELKKEDYDTDSYENHILLCSRCHTLVDDRESPAPIELLREWKRTHEAWVEGLISDALSRVSFVELSNVCDAIADGDRNALAVDYTLTPPLEKMRKNGLSQRVNGAIAMGLSQAHVVQSFLGEFDEIEPGFPDRLIRGFKRQYHLAMANELRGDDLFTHLATHASSDISLQAAQLAVVSYLFHTCDLFEP